MLRSRVLLAAEKLGVKGPEGFRRATTGDSALTGFACTRGVMGLMARLAKFLVLPTTVLLTSRVGERSCSEPEPVGVTRSWARDGR